MTKDTLLAIGSAVCLLGFALIFMACAVNWSENKTAKTKPITSEPEGEWGGLQQLDESTRRALAQLPGMKQPNTHWLIVNPEVIIEGGHDSDTPPGEGWYACYSGTGIAEKQKQIALMGSAMPPSEFDDPSGQYHWTGSLWKWIDPKADVKCNWPGCSSMGTHGHCIVNGHPAVGVVDAATCQMFDGQKWVKLVPER